MVAEDWLQCSQGPDKIFPIYVIKTYFKIMFPPPIGFIAWYLIDEARDKFISPLPSKYIFPS